MKTLLFSICFCILAVACNKSNNIDPTNEAVALDKVVKTTIFNSIEVSETIDYVYDASGKIIAEGANKYTRDVKGRIINIQTPPDGSNRNNIDVYYRNDNSGKIAYTVCRFNTVGAKDSSVYERDNNGRISKIVSHSDERGTIDYFFKLSYDINGNLRLLEKYGVDRTVTVYCGGFYYSLYDDRVNPAYSDDEARILVGSDLFLNTAKNNVISSNQNFSRSHTYRADGRPLSCKVFEGGKQVCRLEYYYK